MASGGSTRDDGHCDRIPRRTIGSKGVAFRWLNSEANQRAEGGDEVELKKDKPFEVHRAGTNPNAGEWPTTAGQG